MKKKIILSSIIGLIFVLLLCTLFFSSCLESTLKFKPNLSLIDDNAFEIHFIDVGQGDAIAIRFPNEKTMLVDSGPTSGNTNLEEYLSKVFFEDDYDTFDYVFLTHSDVDHSGNMCHILNNYTVKNFYRPYIFSTTLETDKIGFKENNTTYDEILTLLENKDVTTYFASDGAKIDTGAGTIEIYTSKQELDETNDYSPFLIVSSNNCKVFLSGDAGENVEEEMINRNCLPEVDLMKLAHHGSKYSNSGALINVLSPKYVVCSVGENSYGHPTSEVLLRLANFDVSNNENTYETFKSTIKDGNIIYYVNENSSMEIVTILSTGDYLFVDWYVVVVAGCVILVVIEFMYVIPKKPIKLNRNLKNMKQ